ncbi:uncharacterized protein LOC120341640 [Styela clava]
MALKIRVYFVVLACVLQYIGIEAQSSKSVPLPTGGESCNVINLHCGAGQSQPNEGELERNPGSPGKRGPTGPAGLAGSKGDQGMKGVKGETGPEVNVTKLQTKIMKMLGAKSCKELNEIHGMTEPGYYLIRSEGRNQPNYVYCDFRVYEGVTNCNGLLERGVRFKSDEIANFLTRRNQAAAIEEISCSNIFTTCHELRQRNTTITSGFYTLHSPTNHQNTFRAYCEFTRGKAITEVRHAQMEEIQSTQSSCSRNKGCYSWIPRYNLNREQIIGIIKQSSECRQFIKARCVETFLLRSGYAWWVSRDGERMNYWGGATSRRDEYCACGETGTCINNSYKCNCDTNSATQGTDEGYLTDKTKLPVKELRFGDLDDSIEFIWHTLGKLECWGEA